MENVADDIAGILDVEEICLARHKVLVDAHIHVENMIEEPVSEMHTSVRWEVRDGKR